MHSMELNWVEVLKRSRAGPQRKGGPLACLANPVVKNLEQVTLD
jgi:hypothetical protein